VDLEVTIEDAWGGGHAQQHVLMLAARHSDGVRSSIQAGQRPRIEYIELIDAHRMELFDYSVLDSMRIPPAILRLVSPLWFVALASIRRHRARHTILAMADDIGIRAALLHGLARLPGRRPKIAIIVHGSYLRSPKFRFVCRLLRSRRDVRFLCLSTSIRDQLIGKLGARPDQVCVVGYGVDTSFFAPSALPNADSALVVAAGTSNRDYRSLVEAVRFLDVDVEIAADSPWFPVKVDIEDAPLPARINCRSAGDYTRLRRLYDKARVVVVPLREAPYASGYAVILEAMSMARPVVTSRITGHSDFVVDGDNGFYVRPGDAEGIRARVAELTERPGLAREVGLRARSVAVEQYSIEKYVERLASGVGLRPDVGSSATR
jgi:glycosyltransferase involved in cell wall biosynthesis